MEFKSKRAMTQAEDKYSFRQSVQICAQTGLITYTGGKTHLFRGGMKARIHRY